MPQGPLPVRSESNIGVSTLLNITATTVVKASSGVCYKAAIVTYGTAAPTLYDTPVAANAAATNEICSIGTVATVGTTPIEWPFLTGLTINPNGGTVTVAFS